MKLNLRANGLPPLIQALSQLYLGYYSVEDLIGMELISGAKSALTILGRAFPRTPTYIEEWFE